MGFRFTFKGWAAVLVILLLLLSPILLPAIRFYIARAHLASLRPMLASRISFLQAQEVARVYEEGQARGLSYQELTEQLEPAAQQMDITVLRLHVRGDLLGRIIARVEYTADGEEPEAITSRYFSMRYSYLTGWQLGSMREVGEDAFDRALWR